MVALVQNFYDLFCGSINLLIVYIRRNIIADKERERAELY